MIRQARWLRPRFERGKSQFECKCLTIFDNPGCRDSSATLVMPSTKHLGSHVSARAAPLVPTMMESETQAAAMQADDEYLPRLCWLQTGPSPSTTRREGKSSFVLPRRRPDSVWGVISETHVYSTKGNEEEPRGQSS